MRPVNRGLPATYKNYPTEPIPVEIQQSILFLSSSLHNTIWWGPGFTQYLQSKVTDINSQLRDHKIKFTWDGFAGLPAFTTINALDDYQEELERIWDQQLEDGADNATLLSTAQKLIKTLETQLSWYESMVLPHIERITRTYTQARGDLITNIGQYCSYCEMPLAASLAVEHMLPKKWFWNNSVSWDNFLLACPICNSIKNDEPSAGRAKREALKTKPDPNWHDLEVAARSLYFWPSDAVNYTSFPANYRHSVFLALRYMDGKLSLEREMTAAQLDPLIRDRALTLAPEDDSGYFKAWMQPDLGSTPATVPLCNGLNAQSLPDIAPIVAVINAVTNANPGLLADAAQYWLPPDKPVSIKTVVANSTWELSQKEGYVITTTEPVMVRFPDNHSVRVAISGQHAALGLASGLLPPAIANVIGVDPLGRTIETQKTGMNEYVAYVSRVYRVYLVNGVMRVRALQINPVEVRLMGANNKANYTAKHLGLNKITGNDPKASDRRTSRRVRAFFAAVDAVGRLAEAIALSDQKLLTDLQSVIIQTAIATGFWSVWSQVFSKSVSDTWGGKNALLAAMGNAFTGTR